MGTLAMVGYCIYKFMLNEDMSTIEFDVFTGKDKNIYPTLSLCFSGKGIFNIKKIKDEWRNIKKKLSPVLWKKNDINTHWDNLLSKFDYDDVSLNPRGILFHVSLNSVNESGRVPIYYWRNRKEKQNMSDPFPFKVSYSSQIEKCFSFDINSVTVPKLEIHTLASIDLRLNKYFGGLKQFKLKLDSESLKKYNIQNKIHLSIFMTYPNQLIRSFPIIVLQNLQKRRKTVIMNAITQGFEMIQRRSTSNQPCEEKWLNDDVDIINRLVSRTGCRHAHWFKNSSIPICDSQKKFKLLKLPDIKTISQVFLKDHISPCREIQSIISTISVRDATQVDFQRNITSMDPMIYLNIQFKNPAYKTIRRIRSFNEETLIGNLGGYVGLFLGVAIWQFPDFIELLRVKMKRCCKRTKT